jgi:ABC-type lipoprotein export system ATPase subunit
MIELKSVTKDYGSQGVTVLKDFNLTIQAGELLAVVGPSGSGKSTLLNLIGAMDTPTSGQIFVEGTDITQLSEEAACAYRASKTGFIFQHHRLMPQCTLLENVLLPTLIHYSSTPKEKIEEAKDLISSIGLGERSDHLPSQLSGGECQRVAILRALINGARVILADEPTGALDHDNAHALMERLKGLSKERSATVVLVTHDQGMLSYADRSLQLVA